MSALWKYLVLLAGIAGIVGFFLPFVHVHARDARFGRQPSAFELVRRLEGLQEMTHSLTALGITTSDAQQMATQAHDQLQTARTAASVIYAPAALLALLGIACGIRRRMGRLAGLLAVIFGAASAAVWAVFHYVASNDPHRGATLAVGAHLLLACGALGILAGLGALVAPDRGATVVAVRGRR
jgi:hypothetical protein